MNGIILRGLLLAFLLVTGGVSAQELNGPRIEVRQDTYALGNVAQGTLAAHVFEVRNSGNEPLIIEKVQPS